VTFMQTNKNLPQPTKRDREIMAHVALLGLTTFDVLMSLFFRDGSRAALKSTLRRLCGPHSTFSFLQSRPLSGKHVYYQLTHRAVQFLGCPSDLALPLGPQARYRRFAVLTFLYGGGRSDRMLFPPDQLAADFALKAHRFGHTDFYIEGDDARPKLGVLIVDHGAQAGRVVAKTMRRLARFLRNHWFDQYILDQNFIITILTPFEGKRQSIAPLLRRAVRDCLDRPIAGGLDHRIRFVEFRVEVVAELQELIPFAQDQSHKD
jgi:hypothetical protein